MEILNATWKPLNEQKLEEIKSIFKSTYPEEKYGNLALKISEYWIQKLKETWETKLEEIKNKDKEYNPNNPLSRIQQKAVVIAYSDSVFKKDEKTLTTLQNFLAQYFPSVKGLHMLPSCEVSDKRFNDGFFSQISRNKIHSSFGSNEQFAEIMKEYYSMTDFVLNHVDIENPKFQAYLNNKDETAKECFYIFSEEEYQLHKSQGDFKNIFRPRPFPLFSIFRKKPLDKNYSYLNLQGKNTELNKKFIFNNLPALPDEILNFLFVFNKIKNDQTLLDEEYQYITHFRKYLGTKSINPDKIFSISTTQETEHTPYIFQEKIKDIESLLQSINIEENLASKYSEIYRKYNYSIFGEEIRALTTFSHVQVDLNTSTYEGLKMLVDDFSWYLKLDLNMLRLDAANFAFKIWGTTCFGLPEINKLLKILYLSMDCVSPRIVPNLEVNNTLSYILNQMSDKESPPPMMYDFHLASMLPIIFNTKNSEILSRIFKKIKEYEIPKESIRFSVVESHDGKSVLGSFDLLSFAERQGLVDVVEQNNGQVKYKGVPKREYPSKEFQDICKETKIDFELAKTALFKETTENALYLKDEIQNESDIAQALNIPPEDFAKNPAFKFMVNKILQGQEPYELCTSTFDSMSKLDNPEQEKNRYLALYTLGFALMGRNVKSIYFNDLLGLPNDYKRFEASGEKRDIKRTKSDCEILNKKLEDPSTVQSQISKEMNKIISIIDSDPALDYRGNEAETISPKEDNPRVAIIHNSCEDTHDFVIINLNQSLENVTIDLSKYTQENKVWFDNISQKEIQVNEQKEIILELQPYERIWLTNKH